MPGLALPHPTASRPDASAQGGQRHASGIMVSPLRGCSRLRESTLAEVFPGVLAMDKTIRTLAVRLGCLLASLLTIVACNPQEVRSNDSPARTLKVQVAADNDGPLPGNLYLAAGAGPPDRKSPRLNSSH